MEQKKESAWGEGLRFGNLLLHIPHSSTAFPEKSGFSYQDLDEEERLLVDYYTDELFLPTQKAEHVGSMVFPYCRLYCDVERLVNDPLEEKGLGIAYCRKSGERCPDRRFSSLRESFAYYADHHAAMSKEIVRMSGPVLLIDCHSFSNLPTLLCSNPPDIDICIGYNEDETCPNKNVLGSIVQHFKSLGYKVGVNEPFSNSKTFAVPVSYHSVMIEVNKRLYMDEQTLGKSEGFYQLQHDIHSLYDVLLRRC